MREYAHIRPKLGSLWNRYRLQAMRNYDCVLLPQIRTYS